MPADLDHHISIAKLKVQQTEGASAAGDGCPSCGYEQLNIPREFSDRAVITCPSCDYSHPHEEFYGVAAGGSG